MNVEVLLCIMCIYNVRRDPRLEGHTKITAAKQTSIFFFFSFFHPYYIALTQLSHLRSFHLFFFFVCSLFHFTIYLSCI